jgi:ribosomal protein L14
MVIIFVNHHYRRPNGKYIRFELELTKSVGKNHEFSGFYS